MQSRKLILIQSILLAALIIPSLEVDLSFITLKLLEYENGIEFDNVIKVQDVYNMQPESNALSDTLYHGNFENNVLVGHLSLQYNNCSKLTADLKKVLQAPMRTLIIVFGLDNGNLIWRSVFGMSAEYFRNSTWLLINPYEDKNGLNKKKFQDSIELWLGHKAVLDFQLYVLIGNSAEASLLEIYKKCKNNKMVVTEVQKIEEMHHLAYDHQDKWERRKDLTGCILRVAYVDDFPFTSRAKRLDELKGIDPRFILKSGNITMYGDGGVNNVELFKHLVSDLNFTISWVKADVYGVYNKESKTWEGIIDLLSKGEADISNAHLINTAIRSAAVTFTNGFARAKYGLFMARPTREPSWSTFLDVFSRNYWLVLLAIGSIMVILLVVFFDNWANTKPNIVVQLINKLMSSTSVLLLGFATLDFKVDEKTRAHFSGSLKIITFVILVLGWFNKEAYEGGLISTLINPKYEHDIKELEDFLTHPDFQLLVARGTAGVDYFSEAKQWPQNHVWKSKLEKNSKAYITSPGDAEKMLLVDKKLVYFEAISSFLPMIKDFPCYVEKARKTYFEGSLAFACRKNSEFVKLFNNQLHLYMETGVMENMAYEKSKKARINCPSDPFLSIGFEVVISAFLVLGLGLCIAVLNLTCEGLYNRYCAFFNPEVQVTTKRKNSGEDEENVGMASHVKESTMRAWAMSIIDISKNQKLPLDVQNDVYKLNNEIFKCINKTPNLKRNFGHNADLTEDTR